MASILTLEFQLECMDYRRENWYHADLDFDTFQVLQVTLQSHDLIFDVAIFQCLCGFISIVRGGSFASDS
jgi:hypothetical protein